MHLEDQHIIPAISNFKDLKAFNKSSIEYCVLLDFQLAELEDVTNELKKHQKKILVHIDLIKGLAPNQYGAIYLAQKLKVEGIISTKSTAIALAKKRGLIAIQRIFLKDSMSLEKSIQLVNKVRPDYLEILPAMTNSVLSNIIEKTQLKVICGGLIQSKEEISACLKTGAIGVTTSNPTLWQ